jgi:prophage antirepressor-like protein
LAEALEYTNTNDAISKHTKEKDQIRFENINTTNKKRHPHTVYLSEAGIYKLVTKSRMKKAEVFSDWVTEEVLPSIRKYGIYKLKKDVEHEKIELIEKINCMEEEVKLLKKELKKEKYPDGGYAYAVDFSTKDKEIYRIEKNEQKNCSVE